MELSASSKAKLKGVHPDLVRVVNRCAKDWTDKQFTFGLTCGVRTLEEQKVLVKKGASKTLKSRHIPAPNGYSHAVDVVAFIDGKVRWDWPLYDKIAKAMKAAAKAEKVPIEWGGDWVSFKDGPHFQLPWASYPGKK
jgi:peptidoglycan L-alanyl-D-glutamate endopeptidase CwlK